MKLRIERGKLIDSLTHVVRSLGPSKTFPILTMVKLVVTDEQVVLTATNMQTEITAIIENSENSPGECCVPGKRFFEVIKNAKKDAFLSIELKQHFLVIKQGRILQKLKTLPTDDYPDVGEIKIDYQLVMASNTLLDMIQKVSPLMAKDDVRYYLNGIHMALDTDSLTLAASNGHGVSVIEYLIDYKQDEKIEIIIANKSIAELLNVLNQDESVELNFSKGKLQINIDNLSLTFQLIDGRFPDYRRVIPAAHSISGSLTINRYDMLNALNRAIPILSETLFKVITITYQTDGNLNLHVVNEEQEESNELVDATLSGDEFSVSINILYLKNTFSVINTKDVILNFSANSGVLITPDDEHFLTVIMPVRK